MECEYYIRTYLYNKDKEDDIIACHSDSQRLPYKIICVDRSSKSSFELFYPLQSISFIESMEKLILNIYNIIYPEAFTTMYKRYMEIRTIASIDLDKPIEKNPKIFAYELDMSNPKMRLSIYNGLCGYYDGRYSISIKGDIL